MGILASDSTTANTGVNGTVAAYDEVNGTMGIPMSNSSTREGAPICAAAAAAATTMASRAT